MVSAYKCGSSVSPNHAARRAVVYNVVARVLSLAKPSYGARTLAFGSITSSSSESDRRCIGPVAQFDAVGPAGRRPPHVEVG